MSEFITSPNSRGKKPICNNILNCKLDSYNLKLCQQGKDKNQKMKRESCEMFNSTGFVKGWTELC